MPRLKRSKRTRSNPASPIIRASSSARAGTGVSIAADGGTRVRRRAGPRRVAQGSRGASDTARERRARRMRQLQHHDDASRTKHAPHFAEDRGRSPMLRSVKALMMRSTLAWGSGRDSAFPTTAIARRESPVPISRRCVIASMRGARSSATTSLEGCKERGFARIEIAGQELKASLSPVPRQTKLSLHAIRRSRTRGCEGST